MSAPEPRSPLATVLRPGRFGAPGALPLRIAERPLSLVLVEVRKGAEGACRDALSAAFGLTLPPPGRAASAGSTTAVWVQPGVWLALAPRAAQNGLARRLANCCAARAATVDLTFARCVVRLAGVRARDVLAKGCRIDLHPRVFGPSCAAQTIIGQISCIVLQVDEQPTFDLIVPSTFAESFLDWLFASAAEYGYEISEPTLQGKLG